MDIRFLGQSAFELTDGTSTVLIDPFLTGNPKAVTTADELSPDVIVLTHGHADHLGDTVAIAKRTGATVIAIVELGNELDEEDGVTVIAPNLGGKVEGDWGSVRYVPAFHTAVSPSGTPHVAAGLVIEFGGKLVYHLGDTCLFSDLKLVKRYGRIDVALVPIGGFYTMDRFDAVTAAEWVGADTVIPCHYDTFPPIEADAAAFKADVEQAGFAQVAVLEPGASFTP